MCSAGRVGGSVFPFRYLSLMFVVSTMQSPLSFVNVLLVFVISFLSPAAGIVDIGI